MLEGKSIDELKKVIAEAEQHIQSMSKVAKEKAFQQIADIAEQVGMTADEVAKYFSKAANSGKKKTGVVRYRDPENPKNTWAGRGRKPKWLQEKLEQGRNLEDFSV